MTSYVIGQEIKAGNVSVDDDVTISKNAWSKTSLTLLRCSLKWALWLKWAI